MNMKFWNEYDFRKVFNETINDDKKIDSQKLFYVACFRTKSNLTCSKLIISDEENKIKSFFSDAKRIEI